MPVWKLIFSALAILILLVGASLLYEGDQIRNRFEVQSGTRPMDVAVDLSNPGQFSVALDQTWSSCHGQTIELNLPTDVDEKVDPNILLDSLIYKWTLTDSSGETVATGDSLRTYSWDNAVNERSIVLASFMPPTQGNYIFDCIVTSGAPELAGMDQRLVSEYQPCGLELLPAAILSFLGMIGIVFGGGISLCVCVSWFSDIKTKRQYQAASN